MDKILITKAIPVITRINQNQVEILLFDHPLAGRQLVKGTIELGETVEAAAVRELWEESSLTDVTQTIFLGTQTFEAIQQRWHFVECILDHAPPDSWEHFTKDGGGLTFSFCWQPIKKPVHNLDGPVFEKARQSVLDLYGL